MQRQTPLATFDMHTTCVQPARPKKGRWEELVIISWQSCIRAGGLEGSKKGGLLSLLRLITARAKSTRTEPAGTRSYLPLVMAKQRFRCPTLQGVLHIL